MNRGPQLIAFTRAQEGSDLWRDGHVQKKSRQTTPMAGQGEGSMDGETVRSFYESLLLSSAPRKASQRRRKVPSAHLPAQEAVRTQNHPTQTDTRKGNQLLKAAQDGNLKALRALVEKDGCDVNYRDDYYWTATMCAAYAGQAEAVRYLLSRGAAWVGVCETQGRDAVDLAEEAGHQEVVEVLQGSGRPRVKEEPSRSRAPAVKSPGGGHMQQATPPAPSSPQSQQEAASSQTSPERKFCAVCQTHYSEDTVALHERSTAHLFNRRDPLPPTRYHIPENNVGFRLMVKGGWDQEAGLGPEGAGRKFPVQTVLKRDQKGLGFHSDLKPKVTHFDAHDCSAVEQPRGQRPRTERAATVGRREARRREAKAQAWERNLRTYMNLDL